LDGNALLSLSIFIKSCSFPVSNRQHTDFYGHEKKLGLPIKTLAAKLEITGPDVGYAVERGARILKDNGYSLHNI
jgi:hypothetical protein